VGVELRIPSQLQQASERVGDRKRPTGKEKILADYFQSAGRHRGGQEPRRKTETDPPQAHSAPVHAGSNTSGDGTKR